MTIPNFISPHEFEMIFNITLAFFAGAIIGYFRVKNDKPAGIRTQILICVGSALLTTISIHLKDIFVSVNADPARLMAQIVTGIGFIGGGVILKADRKVIGLTTAAMIWVTAAIGIAIGSGFYVASVTTIIFVLLLEPIAMLQYTIGLKTKPYILTVKTNKLNRALDILNATKIKTIGNESNNGETFIYIQSSIQKNSLIESRFADNKVSIRIKKDYTQDFRE